MTTGARLAQWWSERFGVALSYDLYALKRKNEPSFSITGLEVLMRTTPGYLGKVNSHTLFLSYQNMKADSAQISALGLGASLLYPAPEKMLRWGDWLIYRVHFPFSGSGSDYKLALSYSLEAFLKKDRGNNTYYEYGAKYESYKFTSDIASEVKLSRVLAFAGMTWLF